MKISVIIPTYKPQGYLWECLSSLRLQTFSKEDFEVLLVLNGCNEPYKSQIYDYGVKHPELPLRLIHTDQGGVSNARNMALDIAKGEFVTFIDDDDYVSPSFLEELYEKASPDTIALCYPYAFMDGKPEIQLSYNITSAYDKLSIKGRQLYPRSRKYFSGPCMKLIPMSFIQGRRYDCRFHNREDSLFIFLISDQFQYVNFTSKNAIYYRRVRESSAYFSKKPLKYLIGNFMNFSKACTLIYFRGGYKFSFYATRLMGAFKGLLHEIRTWLSN